MCFFSSEHFFSLFRIVCHIDLVYDFLPLNLSNDKLTIYLKKLKFCVYLTLMER